MILFPARHLLWLFLLCLIPLQVLAAVDPIATPTFTDKSPRTVEEGYFHLNWEISPIDLKNTFEVEQANDRNFSNRNQIYAGSSHSLFVSGLKEGNYYYRVRSGAQGQVSPWSKPQLIQVRHQSLTKAWLLFGLGALAFIFILWVIWMGSRHNPRQVS